MKKKDLIGQEKMMEIMKRAFARFFAGGLEQIFVMPDCEQAPVYLCCDDRMFESLYCSCVSLISNADGLFVLSADSLPVRGSGYSSLFGQMFRVQFELSDLDVTMLDRDQLQDVRELVDLQEGTLQFGWSDPEVTNDV